MIFIPLSNRVAHEVNIDAGTDKVWRKQCGQIPWRVLACRCFWNALQGGPSGRGQPFVDTVESGYKVTGYKVNPDLR